MEVSGVIRRRPGETIYLPNSLQIGTNSSTEPSSFLLWGNRKGPDLNIEDLWYNWLNTVRPVYKNQGGIYIYWYFA